MNDFPRCLFAFYWVAEIEVPHWWFSNISLLSSAEEPGTNLQMHLENSAFICPGKLSGSVMWVTQTLDLHPMALNFKSAVQHNLSPCNLSAKPSLWGYLSCQIQACGLQDHLSCMWELTGALLLTVLPSSDLKGTFVFLIQLPLLAQTWAYFSVNSKASGRWCQEGVLPPTTGNSCQSECCLAANCKTYISEESQYCFNIWI